ncbi:hypothetical protein Trydic_g20146 [Trypoxylus dichotomus]
MVFLPKRHDLGVEGPASPGKSYDLSLGVILNSRMNWGAHIHHVLDCGRQMSGTLYPLLERGRLYPSRVLQPDTADGLQRPLVRKEHHATRRRRNGTIHRLHPKNSHPIPRPSGGPLEPPRVDISGLYSYSS